MYAAINALVQEAELPLASVCEVLEVSRSAYYAWRVGEPSQREQQEATLDAVGAGGVLEASCRRYGTRRIADGIGRPGRSVQPPPGGKTHENPGFVQAFQPKSFVPKTTDSRHRLGYSPNLILDKPEPRGVNQLWVGAHHVCAAARRRLLLPGGR